MPPSFRVSGGRPLNGTIRPAGNKNAALPILAATLLADGPCRIDNVPHIRDVETMLELLAHLGAAVAWTAPNSVEVNTAAAEPRELDPKLSARIRASILLAGPMLARFGRVNLPPPGGDVIGRRRVDTHFLALERLGTEITVGATYQLEAKTLRGADIFLDEPSVTATENALMAAVAAAGTTILRNTASEPHVQDLARYLVGLGGRIDGIGSNTLTVEGGAPLHPALFTIGPDHIEIGSFLGLAAVTNGAVTIDGVRPDDLRATLMAFERLGVRPRLDRARLIVDADQERRIRPDLGGHVPKLEDGPWPAFPADLMSIAIVVASQCEGLLLVFEKLFESRLFFVDKLIGMGARIVLCDPHRAVISGPSPLHGQVVESPDIRAGMAMLLAARAAQGDSVIHGTAVQWHRAGQPGWLILDGVDGHATRTPGVLLTVTVADCVPVYLVAPHKRVVALLHAGWRGTAGGMLERGVAAVRREAFVMAEEIVMHCGVGICGACYEVGSEVLAQLTPGRATAATGHVDLRAVLVRQAAELGVREVSVSPWCSAHDRAHFFSHRGSGGRDGRMIAYLGVPA